MDPPRGGPGGGTRRLPGDDAHRLPGGRPRAAGLLRRRVTGGTRGHRAAAGRRGTRRNRRGHRLPGPPGWLPDPARRAGRRAAERRRGAVRRPGAGPHGQAPPAQLRGVRRVPVLRPGDRLPVVRLPGPAAAAGTRCDVAIAICEDLWQDGGPVAVTRQAGAGLLVVPNASPYERGKSQARLELCRPAGPGGRGRARLREHDERPGRAGVRRGLDHRGRGRRRCSPAGRSSRKCCWSPTSKCRQPTRPSSRARRPRTPTTAPP